MRTTKLVLEVPPLQAKERFTWQPRHKGPPVANDASPHSTTTEVAGAQSVHMAKGRIKLQPFVFLHVETPAPSPSPNPTTGGSPSGSPFGGEGRSGGSKSPVRMAIARVGTDAIVAPPLPVVAHPDSPLGSLVHRAPPKRLAALPASVASPPPAFSFISVTPLGLLSSAHTEVSKQRVRPRSAHAEEIVAARLANSQHVTAEEEETLSQAAQAAIVSKMGTALLKKMAFRQTTATTLASPPVVMTKPKLAQIKAEEDLRRDTAVLLALVSDKRAQPVSRSTVVLEPAYADGLLNPYELEALRIIVSRSKPSPNRTTDSDGG